MKNIIAVIGGTPYDTKAGELFLRKKGYKDILSFSIAENPEEQNRLQYTSPEKLEQSCLEICITWRKKGIKKILIYCNSLSSILDVETLATESQTEIITPIEAYSILGKSYSRIAIIAANSSGTMLAEKHLRKNGEKDIISLGYLDLVKQIERGHPAEEILRDLNFAHLTSFLELQSIELILLSCTHFPYITSALQDLTTIRVLDLDMGMERLI